jgi:hypothetical protein
MPRPRILNDVRRHELCRLLAAGREIGEAARAVGCSLRTVRRESASDEGFGRQLSEARLAGRLDPVDHLRQAALTDWRAAAWLLERLDPQQFARRSRSTCTPKDLQTLVDRVIETALQDIDDHATRTRVYRSATAVAQRGFSQLFPAPQPNEQRLRRGRMPLREMEELNELLDDLRTANRSDAGEDAAASARGFPDPAAPADRTPAQSAATANHAAKTDPATDKTRPHPPHDKSAPQPTNPGWDPRRPADNGCQY